VADREAIHLDKISLSNAQVLVESIPNQWVSGKVGQLNETTVAAVE